MTLVQTEYDYVFKILLIGNTGVGKSSLLMRFASDIFSESFLPTLGVDFKIRTMQAGEKLLKLQIWDTAGQEKFKNIVASYYRGTHGILLVFDITDKNSFLDVQTWMEEAGKYSPEGVVRILIGNKKDLHLERSVPYEEAKNFAESLGIHYL
jgi:Ras-related protein Rab-1A